MASLEDDLEAAESKLATARDRKAVAELHRDQLEAHYKSGAWWTTYSDEKTLQAEFDARNRAVTDALSDLASANGQVNDARRALEQQNARYLAAEQARKIALENKKEPEAQTPELELVLKGPQQTP